MVQSWYCLSTIQTDLWNFRPVQKAQILTSPLLLRVLCLHVILALFVYIYIEGIHQAMASAYYEFYRGSSYVYTIYF